MISQETLTKEESTFLKTLIKKIEKITKKKPLYLSLTIRDKSRIESLKNPGRYIYEKFTIVTIDLEIVFSRIYKEEIKKIAELIPYQKKEECHFILKATNLKATLKERILVDLSASKENESFKLLEELFEKIVKSIDAPRATTKETARAKALAEATALLEKI